MAKKSKKEIVDLSIPRYLQKSFHKPVPATVVEKQRFSLMSVLRGPIWTLLSLVGPIMFYVTFGSDWGRSFHKSVQPYLEGFIGKEFSEFFTYLIMSIVGITMVVVFAKALIKVAYPGAKLGPYQGSSQGLSNIEKAYKYRDSKMAMMDNETAAKFQMETSSLNNVFMNERATSYMNSKMSMMDNESKLDVLKGK